MKTKKILSYLDEFLRVKKIDDSSYNGLQVEGKEDVKTVCFAVDSGVEVFEAAVKENADMLVVHHGLFWEKTDPRLIGANKKRAEVLLMANINLYAAHLPLDMHEEVGNNAQIIELSGAKADGRFYRYKSDYIGALGKFDVPRKVSQIAEVLEEKLGAKTHILGEENREIRKIAAVSGGVGADTVSCAKEAGAELLVVGEKRDFYHWANDCGVSVIFCGHHASEQTGIWALQEHVQKKFPKLVCTYIPCHTGL